MSRQIDATLAAGFANANIQPIILAALTFASGVVYVWNGVGPLTWNSNTYQRRYTSADQRQVYSDDTAFSWVEMLNDEALRWGS